MQTTSYNNMFAIESINVNNFIESVMRANDVLYLTEIEKQIETYMNKHEDDLFIKGTIWDVLDIRDTIILRIAQLNRRVTMTKYLN
jgi:hypothetical protein